MYDPDVGGDVDEINGFWDTKMSYSIYEAMMPIQMMMQRVFSLPVITGAECCWLPGSFEMDKRYDDNWYAFGPLNPTEGEYIADLDGYIFKIICEENQ
ncbi:MAG: hypothetical protein R2744_07640 [Bacteroidales bacterium]